MNIAKRYRSINKALRLALSGDAEDVLAAALEILATRIKHGDAVNSPGAVRDYDPHWDLATQPVPAVEFDQRITW